MDKLKRSLYEKPEVEVMEIVSSCNLLAGSIDAPSMEDDDWY